MNPLPSIHMKYQVLFSLKNYEKVFINVVVVVVVVVVALLFYVHGNHLSLTTLFLDRLRPPKRLTSTSCTYFRQ